MLAAVPITVSAMGKVAHFAEGAKSAPTRLPTSIVRVIIEAASALLRVNIQTFLKPGVELIFTELLVGWLLT
jgi:hypothetical protein